MKLIVLEDILAVVVIYNTVIANCPTLLSLHEDVILNTQEFDVVIYDNSILPQSLPDIFLKKFRFHYYHDDKNSGVSRAYNYAAKIATQKNKKYILLLDQDTIFPINSLSKYVETINKYQDLFLFCPILKSKNIIYSPSKYYFRRGMHWNNLKPGVYFLKNKTALNSGLAISLQAYNEVKGYNEDIKLYFSDFDFINRFRVKYKKMFVMDLTCSHSLSDIDTTDTKSAILRFKHYVIGSYFTIYSKKDFIYLFITILFRALKLSIKFKSLIFMKIFFNKYVLDSNA